MVPFCFSDSKAKILDVVVDVGWRTIDVVLVMGGDCVVVVVM